jgi:uncharacterized damage-inducible protein DinB
MENQVVETWNIHNRIHLYLLNGIPEEALSASLAPKGPNVYALFAHIHNVRLMWLKSAAPNLLEGLEKLEPKPVGTRGSLETALTASGQAIEILLQRGMENNGVIRGFKPHAVAFLGYMISHESHHRGQIEWILKHSDYPLDDKVSYGLWEWGVR